VLRIQNVYPGSEIFPSRVRFFSIPDPKFFHPGSEFFPPLIPVRIFPSRTPDPIRIKEFKYFNPNKWLLSSREYDPVCSSRIRILLFYPSRIPDPGVKRAPDPGSGSATQYKNIGSVPLSVRYQFNLFTMCLLMVLKCSTALLLKIKQKSFRLLLRNKSLFKP
jgi:hypothetical protein